MLLEIDTKIERTVSKCEQWLWWKPMCNCSHLCTVFFLLIFFCKTPPILTIIKMLKHFLVTVKPKSTEEVWFYQSLAGSGPSWVWFSLGSSTLDGGIWAFSNDSRDSCVRTEPSQYCCVEMTLNELDPRGLVCIGSCSSCLCPFICIYALPRYSLNVRFPVIT